MLFISNCGSWSISQIRSNALVSISENGEMLTDTVYVKFKASDVFKIPSSGVKISGDMTSEANGI